MDTKISYVQDAKTSDARKVRIEITGRVSDNEKNFISGISFFTASALGKNSDTHLRYVSGIMLQLIKHLAACKTP